MRGSADDRDYAFNRLVYVKRLAESFNAVHHPVVVRALDRIKRFADKPGIVDEQVARVEKSLKARREVGKLRPNPFKPNPIRDDIDGEVHIGNARPSGARFGLDLDEIGEHVLITGRAGAGKTTLIYIILDQLLERGIPFWAFDFKQDYRHLLNSHEVLVFDSESFRFNPLRPPPGVSPKTWMQTFANIFCQSYHLLVASKKIVLGEVKRLYEDYGVFSGSQTYPSMFDLYESLMHFKPKTKSYRKLDWLESAKNRVDECLISFDTMFDCDQGFRIEDLLEKNVVFESEGLVTYNQAFLISIILRYVFQYRISNNQRSSLKHIFLFDEAKTVYDREKEFNKDLGISEIAQFTSKIRAFGEGLVVADQMPIKLADSIKANVYSVICMSQSGGPNINSMSQALGLSPKQMSACRKLIADKKKRVFEAVVKLNGKWQTPFLIKIRDYDVIQDVSDLKLDELMASHLEALQSDVTKRTEHRTFIEEKLKKVKEKEREENRQRQEKVREKAAVEGNMLIKILTNIRDFPFIDQKTRKERLGLTSSSTANKYFNELKGRAFVNEVTVSLGRGHRYKFYEITEKGQRFAKMDKVKIPGKGDFEHKFYQHKIKEFYQNLGYNAEIEKSYLGKNVDVGFDMDGKKTAVEIQLSKNHLRENIAKNFAAGCEKIIIAVKSKRLQSSCEKEIGFYSPEEKEKIDFILLTNFLSSGEKDG